MKRYKNLKDFFIFNSVKIYGIFLGYFYIAGINILNTESQKYQILQLFSGLFVTCTVLCTRHKNTENTVRSEKRLVGKESTGDGGAGGGWQFCLALGTGVSAKLTLALPYTGRCGVVVIASECGSVSRKVVGSIPIRDFSTVNESCSELLVEDMGPLGKLGVRT